MQLATVATVGVVAKVWTANLASMAPMGGKAEMEVTVDTLL